jgi:hypothetical protein
VYNIISLKDELTEDSLFEVPMNFHTVDMYINKNFVSVNRNIIVNKGI